MAWLGEEIGEGVLGTPRCTKDLIEEALFDRGRDLFSEVGLVFFDTTSIYFEGAGGQSIGRHGHSKDHRPDLHQMRYDGLFVLRTDTDHDAETIARVYKMLWMVEDSFRTAKSIMETRPIFHKCDETIRGHVFCSFLALVLKRELEIRMEQKGLAAEWAEVVRGLDNLQQVELFLQGSRFLLRSQLKGDASQAIRAAEVALPPVLQEIA